MLKLHAGQFTIDAAQGDQPRRMISGIAVRYNTEAVVSDGTRVMFAPGSIPTDGPAPKLFMFHDPTKVIGTVVELAEVDNVLLFSAKVAETVLGSEALVLASAGALSDVSVGVEPLKFKYDNNGVMVITASRFMELSVVPHGAFDAPILDVAASIHQDEEEISNNQEVVPEQENEMAQEIEAPAVIEASPVQQTIFAAARKEAKLPTAVEYISAAIAGGSAWHDMSAALRAAAPDVTTTDTPGILPTPIVGPVYNNFIGRRPVVDAIGVRAMPGGGKVFIRPEVTTHTSMAVQSAENAALQSGTLVVFNNQVTKNTYGGYVVLSEQDMDWSDPGVISIILDDMARIYANATDNVAADNLVAGASVTAAFSAASETDPSYWQAWVSAAATTILSGSNGNLPTHLFVSPDFWGTLMGLSDSSKRPLFPAVGPMNAYGNLQPGQPNGVAFGLNVVVDRNFAANTLIVGDASGYEIFEQQKGAISLDNPSTISRTLAWRGYFATLMIDQTKFVKAVRA
jgi:hypothetical protein